ncbi:MAG: hypothetical protein WC391_08150, partial [Methanoregula sp.]
MYANRSDWTVDRSPDSQYTVGNEKRAVFGSGLFFNDVIPGLVEGCIPDGEISARYEPGLVIFDPLSYKNGRIPAHDFSNPTIWPYLRPTGCVTGRK